MTFDLDRGIIIEVYYKLDIPKGNDEDSRRACPYRELAVAASQCDAP